MKIRNLIRKLGRLKTVIISSHILAEISAVCDHVIIISHGNIVANDTLENLEASASRNNALTLKIKGDKARAEKLISSVPGVASAEYSENGGVVSASVIAEEGSDIREAVFNAFASAKMPILDMHTNETTLEDIFLGLAYGSDERNAYIAEPEEEEEIEEEKPKAKEEDDYKPLFSSSDDEEDDE